MMLHTLGTSIRLLLKHKTYTAINLTGLVLGLTASFILFTFIINERSYNRIENSKRIFRVLTMDHTQQKKSSLTPFYLSDDLKANFPQIEQSSRWINVENLIGPVKINQNGIFRINSGFSCADPSILPLFDIKLKGLKNSQPLSDSNSIMVSCSAASEMFGTIDPLGQSCQVQVNGEIFFLNITGIFDDLPWNSTIHADFIAGISFYRKLLKNISSEPEKMLNSCDINTNETYILLKNNTQIEDITNKINALYKHHYPANPSFTYFFQPFPDIYLGSSDFINDYNLKGDRSNLYTYGLLAAFILFLAGMNYAILSTARSSLRYKEIGVRKVFGATGKQLQIQLITESVMLTFLSFPISLLLLGLIDPFMEQWFGFSVNIHFSNLLIYFSVFAGITIMIGLLSGIYVAVYLASLDPLYALRMKLFAYKRFTLSKFFIVFQLVITLSLLIGFIAIYRQISFFLNNSLGVQKDNLIVVHFNPEEFKFYHQLKQTISKQTGVLAVSGSSMTLPVISSSVIRLSIPGPPEKEIELDRYFVDYDFFETMGIKLKSGSDFNINDSLINYSRILLNQEAAKVMGLQNPLEIMIGMYKIFGIVDNFNIRTLHQKIQPAMFCFQPQSCKNVLVRYKTGEQEQLIAAIKKSWYHLAPSLPFNYSVFDQDLERMYIKEKRFGKVVAAFTLLAFVITGMGLFGLALLITERRRKEISIRKIFGASNIHLMIRLQREFYIYIGIATCISFPVSWYLMNEWLHSFYYYIPLNAFIFVISVLSVFIFVALILLYRTIVVLKEKPVDVLKYE